MCERPTFRLTLLTAAFGAVLAAAVTMAGATEPPNAADPVSQAENRRVEMIQRVGSSVVCLFDRNQRGGGGGSRAAMPGPEASTGEPGGG